MVDFREGLNSHVKPKQRSFLSGTFFVVFAFWQLTAIAGVVFPIVFGFSVLLFPLFLIILIADYRSLVGESAFLATLRGPRSPALGTTVIFCFQLEVQKKSVFSLKKVTVEAPRTKHFSYVLSWVTCSHLSVGQGSGLVAEMQARAVALGHGEVTAASVVVYSHRGLWYRTLELSLGEFQYRVIPSLQKVPEQVFIEMISRQRLLLQGSRLVMRGRTVDQFYTIRKYQYPDALRHIDHKKTARYGEVMTRVYDSYYQHHLCIVLDLGRAMCGELVGSKKHDYYLSAALVLAENAIMNGDAVSFYAFSRKVRMQIPRVRSLKPFYPLYRGVDELEAREEESNFEILKTGIPQFIGQRSIVVVLTDLSKPFIQDALVQNLGQLCQKHLTVVLSLLDQNYDLRREILLSTQPMMTEERFAKILYSYWLQEHLKIFGTRVSRLGGAAVVISDEYWISATARIYRLLRSSLRA